MLLNYHLGLMWTQYSLNFFVYAYMSEQYRSAYRDFLSVIFPCIPQRKSTGHTYSIRKGTKEADEMEIPNKRKTITSIKGRGSYTLTRTNTPKTP